MVKITIDTRDLKKLTRELDRLQFNLPRAIAQGLNRGGNAVRSSVQHALQDVSGLKNYKSVTSRVRTHPASLSDKSTGAQRLAYTIHVSSKKTKPEEYRVSVKEGRRGFVTVYFWGVAHKFKHSFRVGGTGRDAGKLRMRKGDVGRMPIHGFDGPNLAKEAVKGEPLKAFEEGVATLVLPEIEKQLRSLIK